MQKRFHILAVLFCSVVLSLSAQVYHVPEQNGYDQRVSSMPATSEFRSTSSFQSTSSLSGNYTVPFAAGEAAEIGASSPTGGPRKAPPVVDGGEENKPDSPGYNQPLTDGVGILLLAALVYALVIIRRRNALVKE